MGVTCRALALIRFSPVKVDEGVGGRLILSEAAIVAVAVTVDTSAT